MTGHPLARRLGLGDAVLIGLGSMVGAGVFSAFAPAADPQVAVVVFIESGANVSADSTGGVVAAPIGRQVIAAALQGS